jgi:hypothetical protein
MKKALMRCRATFAGWAFVGLAARSAWAQGCPMCYQSAAASSAAGRASLRHGILVLLLPALSCFAGICVLIYKRRNVWR